MELTVEYSDAVHSDVSNQVVLALRDVVLQQIKERGLKRYYSRPGAEIKDIEYRWVEIGAFTKNMPAAFSYAYGFNTQYPTAEYWGLETEIATNKTKWVTGKKADTWHEPYLYPEGR